MIMFFLIILSVIGIMILTPKLIKNTVVEMKIGAQEAKEFINDPKLREDIKKNIDGVKRVAANFNKGVDDEVARRLAERNKDK